MFLNGVKIDCPFIYHLAIYTIEDLFVSLFNSFINMSSWNILNKEMKCKDVSFDFPNLLPQLTNSRHIAIVRFINQLNNVQNYRPH